MASPGFRVLLILFVDRVRVVFYIGASETKCLNLRVQTFFLINGGWLRTSMSMNEKRSVALLSVLAAVFLTGMKLTVGLLTNSLGILSEAAHSGLDLVAALMTLFAVKISDKPADETHHYGHGKVEGFSAFFEVILLMVTCGYIIYEAVERIIGKSAHVEVNVYSFAVMAISIVVDISRSTSLYRVAKKYKSQALEADALHFSSDIWSSAVVIAGLLGYKFFGLVLADSIAALVVAVLVIVVSIRLGIRTVNVLLDKAPPGMRQSIEEAVAQLPGAERLESLRIRTSGVKTFVDMRLTLSSDLSFSEAHRIASTAEKNVSQLIPGADVIVHADPAPLSLKAVPKDKISSIMKEHRGLFVGYHDLNIIHHQDTYLVNMHLVMAADSHVEEAHEVCDHLEAEIKQVIPGATVTIHIEPRQPSPSS
jgi:cation diffusion facilitator family transporter